MNVQIGLGFMMMIGGYIMLVSAVGELWSAKGYVKKEAITNTREGENNER